MSLETAVQENTAVIRELITALNNGLIVTPTNTPVRVKAESLSVKAAEKPAPKETAGKAFSGSEQLEPEKYEPVKGAGQQTGKPVNKEDALKAGTALLKAKKAAGLQAVLAECQSGAKTLGDVRVENYAKFIEMCQAAIVA